MNRLNFLVRQRNAFNTLMENYSTTYKPALEEARSSEGSSEKKYEAYSDSVTAALQRYAAGWEGFAEKLNASPLIINLVNILTKLTGVLEFMAPKLIQFFSTYFAYKIPGMIDSAKGLLGLPGGDFIRNVQTMGVKGALKEAGSTIVSPAKKAFESATMGRRAAWEVRDEKMAADLAKHDTDYTGALDDARARMGKGEPPVVPVKETEKPKETPKAETTPSDEGMVTKTADQLNVDQQNQQVQQGQTGTPQLVPVQNQPQGEAPATPGEAPVELDNEAANKNNQAADKMGQAADKISQAADKMVANAGQEQPLGSSPNMSPDARGYIGTGKTVTQGTATGELVSDASGKQFIKVKGKQIGTKSEFVANPNFDKGKFDPSGILTPYGALTNENFELSKSGQYKLKWSKIKEQELGTHTQLSRLRTTELPQSEKTTPVYGYDYIPYVGKGEPEQPKYKPQTTYQKGKKKGSGGGDDDGTGAGGAGKPSAKQRLKSNAYYAAAAGVSTFATNANEYGYQGIIGQGFGYNDVKLDEGEKWGLAGVTGAGTAALTAWLGPIGQVLSQIINDGVYTLWKGIFHAEDKARADRVKAAKENLDSLNKMNSSVDKLASTTAKAASEMDALDFSNLQTAVDNLKSSFTSLDNRVKKSYTEELTRILKGMGITGVNDLNAALNKMLTTVGDNTDEARKIAAAIKATQIGATATQTYKAAEEDRNSAVEELAKEQYSIVRRYNATSDIQIKENIANEYYRKYNETIGEGQVGLSALEQKRDASREDYLESIIEKAIEATGASLMSDLQAGRTSPETLVRTIATEVAQDNLVGNEVYGVGGQVTEAFKSSVLLALKANTTTNQAFKGSNISLANLWGMKDILESQGVDIFKDYQKWSKMASAKNPSKEFQDLAEALKLTEDQLRDMIFKIDPNVFTVISSGLGMTVEELEASGDKFHWVTQSLVIGSLSDVIEAFDALSDAAIELTSTGRLSADALSNFAKKYPSLLYDEKGNLDQQNIVGNLIEILWKGAASTGLQLLSNKMIEYYETGEGAEEAWNVFTSDRNLGGPSTDIKTWENWFKKQNPNANLDKDDLAKLIDPNTKTFADVSNIFLKYGAVDAWSDTISKLVYDIDLVSEMRDKYVEYRVNEYEKEIEDLNSIKDTLGDINKQREKELELLKARDALENAKNERKRVYRAGVGFTYEADQSAIAEAQEKVDQLEAQRTQEDVEYQISLLEQQKAILENLSKDEQMEQLIKTMSEFSAKFPSNTYGLLEALKPETLSNNIANAIKQVDADRKQELEDQRFESNELKNLKEAKQNWEKVTSGLSFDEDYNNFISGKVNSITAGKGSEDWQKEYNAIVEEAQNTIYNTSNPNYANLANQVKTAGYNYSSAYKKAQENNEAADNRYDSKLSGYEDVLANDNSNSFNDKNAKYNAGDTQTLVAVKRWESNKRRWGGKGGDDVLYSTTDEMATPTYGDAAVYTPGVGWEQRDNLTNVDYEKMPNGTFIEWRGKYYHKQNGIWYVARGNDPIRGKDILGFSTEDSFWNDDFINAFKKPSFWLGTQKSEFSNAVIYYIKTGLVPPFVDDSVENAFESNKTDIDNAIKNSGLTRMDYMNGLLNALSDGLDDEERGRYLNFSSNAKGNLSFRGGSTLINENGLEGIVTPQGTLTSLPARSGILPADLTKNLWTLGELAPGLVSRLGSIEPQIDDRNMTEDNSIHIATLNATFTATNDFDMNKFLRDVRSVVSTTNNL